MGLKPPSSLGSAISSKLKSEIGSKLNTPLTGARKSVAVASSPGGPRSALRDAVDEIHSNPDPIDVSITIRKKKGNVNNVIPDPKAKVGKFFFTLRTKGDLLVITSEAKLNNIKEAWTDKNGNRIVEDKP